MAARAVGPAIVIAADTVVVLEGAILGKPRTSEDARQMLEKLSGRTHSVVTGVTLIRLPDVERREFIETTQVHFASISKEEIVQYLASGEPFDKAGSYAIQGLAGRYIPASMAATSMWWDCRWRDCAGNLPSLAGRKNESGRRLQKTKKAGSRQDVPALLLQIFDKADQGMRGV